jgi:hypothetical protein
MMSQLALAPFQRFSSLPAKAELCYVADVLRHLVCLTTFAPSRLMDPIII